MQRRRRSLSADSMRLAIKESNKPPAQTRGHNPGMSSARHSMPRLSLGEAKPKAVPLTPRTLARIDEHGCTEGQIRRKIMSDSHSECTPVLDYLYVGGEDVATDREILASIGITAVVNCAADQVPSEFSVELGIRYLNLRMVDGNMEDLSWYVCEVIQFIRSAQLCGGKVLVHCHAGVSRSCALVIAYFMWNTGSSWNEAFEFVKARRTACAPNTAFMCQLIELDNLFHRQVSTGLLFRLASHLPHDTISPVLKLCRNPRTREIVRVAKSQLDSRGVFVIRPASDKMLYIWQGVLASDGLLQIAKVLSKNMLGVMTLSDSIAVIREGEEDENFWKFVENDIEGSPGHMSFDNLSNDLYADREDSTSISSMSTTLSGIRSPALTPRTPRGGGMILTPRGTGLTPRGTGLTPRGGGGYPTSAGSYTARGTDGLTPRGFNILSPRGITARMQASQSTGLPPNFHLNQDAIMNASRAAWIERNDSLESNGMDADIEEQSASFSMMSFDEASGRTSV